MTKVTALFRVDLPGFRIAPFSTSLPKGVHSTDISLHLSVSPVLTLFCSFSPNLCQFAFLKNIVENKLNLE